MEEYGGPNALRVKVELFTTDLRFIPPQSPSGEDGRVIQFRKIEGTLCQQRHLWFKGPDLYRVDPWIPSLKFRDRPAGARPFVPEHAHTTETTP